MLPIKNRTLLISHKKTKKGVAIKTKNMKIASERWNYAQDVDGNCFIGISVPNTTNKYQIIASVKENLSNERKKEVSFLLANAPYLLDALIDLLNYVEKPDTANFGGIDVIEKAKYAIETSLTTKKQV